MVISLVLYILNFKLASKQEIGAKYKPLSVAAFFERNLK